MVKLKNYFLEDFLLLLLINRKVNFPNNYYEVFNLKRKKDEILAETQTRDNYLKDKKITAKQWKIYFYLLSISKYNSEKKENHRYVYKNSINIA